jgi:hypothetical protein
MINCLVILVIFAVLIVSLYNTIRKKKKKKGILYKLLLFAWITLHVVGLRVPMFIFVDNREL